ncbi:tyrosinase family protein [Bradyrhizobium sp. BWA-3-5]|uniref:tyrosinase family protein n=1 Tax=Bradyrhizobium sp. BWA-3-5 TaxID=3080013 RepID=UPI00293E4F84|nr:tyrosinase family protein [Bradyrhizobium sp. BWA-3-5]WOH63608.1 tyrosinase family protein [Bradyrhizobium sp. BWA-3-5]
MQTLHFSTFQRGVQRARLCESWRRRDEIEDVAYQPARTAMRIHPILIILYALISIASNKSGAASIEMQIGEAASDRGGFICWSPVRSRARLLTDSSSEQKLTVSSVSSEHGGRVAFQQDGFGPPNKDSYSPSSTLNLTLPSNGAWVSFWIMGTKASIGAKDVRVLARNDSGEELGSVDVMVRVRKNAESLTGFEAQIFLDALKKLHNVSNNAETSEYEPFVRIHEAANQLEIHRSPLFLPWHRALILDLERRLQNIDPRVALPYWRFDAPAARVFSDDFMGATVPGLPFVSGPGLGDWIDPNMGRLIRDPAVLPNQGVLDPIVPATFHQAFVIFHRQIESSFHSGVHRNLGGWLAGATSPADPLFFLLHANVDRVWAHWQATYSRFQASDEAAYSAQGKYPGTGPDAGIYRKGTYADDPMWPWGYLNPTDASGWPATTHGMPGMNSPSEAPSLTPARMVDYLGSYDNSAALGYCYDDIDYLGRPIR